MAQSLPAPAPPISAAIWWTRRATSHAARSPLSAFTIDSSYTTGGGALPSSSAAILRRAASASRRCPPCIGLKLPGYTTHPRGTTGGWDGIAPPSRPGTSRAEETFPARTADAAESTVGAPPSSTERGETRRDTRTSGERRTPASRNRRSVVASRSMASSAASGRPPRHALASTGAAPAPPARPSAASTSAAQWPSCSRRVPPPA
mmetsp:Transcript_47859/g.93500  ORF Transcript_47859/g.93500 Transcript_47859/m.93500 type:complete len:205 (-) Transcript_47859:68-682(-)